MKGVRSCVLGSFWRAPAAGGDPVGSHASLQGVHRYLTVRELTLSDLGMKPCHLLHITRVAS